MKRVFGQSIPKKSTEVNETRAKSSKSLESVSNAPVTETFRNDYNILNLHAKILAKFETERAKIADIEKEYHEQKKIYDTTTSLSEYRKAEIRMGELETEMNKLKKQENHYHSLTSGLIERYKELVKTKKPKKFGQTIETDENTKKRENLIVQYAMYAKQFIDVNLVLITSNVSTCSCCGEEIKPGMTSCPSCHVLIDEFDTETSYKDSDRINAPFRSTYIKSDHIIDSFIEFQGKQENKIPKDVIDDVYNTVKSYNIPFSKITIDSVYQILKDKKYNDHYNDVYLIYHLITGNPLPNLEYIKEEFCNDAKRFAEIYPLVKPANRSNCLTAHFIRDSILRRHGLVFPEWQCTYLRTSNATQNHNEVMKKAYEILKWGDYVPI